MPQNPLDHLDRKDILDHVERELPAGGVKWEKVPEKTALICIDMQKAFVSVGGNIEVPLQEGDCAQHQQACTNVSDGLATFSKEAHEGFLSLAAICWVQVMSTAELVREIETRVRGGEKSGQC